MKTQILLLCLVLAAGCVSNTNTANISGENLTSSVPIDSLIAVTAGDHVFVDYTGTLENGTVFDTSIGRAPLDFIVGAGQMIKGFDQAVMGMKTGEEKTVTLKPEDAYGFSSDKNIINVSKENVPPGVKAGDTLSANGFPVKVIEVTNDTVVIDANHPLAGKTLIFKIKIVKIERNQTGTA